MPFEDVLRNPLVRKALEAGEEQVGRVMGRLLGSDGLASGLQSVLSGAAHAREKLEKGVSQALHAVNLPSKDDVAGLRRKLEELEAMIDGLAERIGPTSHPLRGAGPTSHPLRGAGRGRGDDGA